MESPMLYPLQLLDVRLYTVSLERRTSEASGASDAPETDPELSPPALVATLETVRHAERQQVSVFVTVAIKGPEAAHPEFDLRLTLEGLFEAQLDLDAIAPSTWEEFEKVSAITLLWPYVRESVHSFSQRMRTDLPLLPTFNRMGMQQAAATVAP